MLQENTHLFEMDLSYNKITGKYNHGTPGPNQSVTLQVNRLSGRLQKKTLELSGYLNILVDNRFSCSTIPSSDLNADDYSCESIDLDKSLYTMMSLLGFLLILFVVVMFYRHYLVNYSSLAVGIEAEPYALQRLATLLVNGSLYFGCLDDLNTLTSDHFLLKISNFSEELYAIMKGSVGLCVVSIIMSIPLYSLKIAENGFSDGDYSTYARMYSWLISAAHISGELPAVLLLLNWGVLMIFFVFFIWRFSKKYGELFFERFSASNATSDYSVTVRMIIVVLCNCGINTLINVVYIFFSSHNTSRTVTVMLQLLLAVWKIFTSLVIVPFLSKPIKDFEKCIKTRLFMFISNSMIIPCLVAMRISPSCFEVIRYLHCVFILSITFYVIMSGVNVLLLTSQSMFHRPDPISSLYSYEDCSRSTLMLSSGLFECSEYAQYSIDVPPLIPPFSYNYDCSSVILTAYIPVYIYMYSLLAMVPLALMLFGVTFRYHWIPDWLQPRVAGILWPYHWSMRGVTEHNDKENGTVDAHEARVRVRTFSDMSTDSSVSEGEGDSINDSAPSLQQIAEPQLMVNVIPIITQLMHNIFILSTFGLCSPFLAIVIVCYNSSHIVMWKVLLGRFVACRIIKAAELKSKKTNAKCRESAISHDEFMDFNIHQLMTMNTASTHDTALIALSEQLNNAKGIFAICIWPILLCSSFFFIFVSLDIAGDRVSWTGGLWIPAILCVVPLLLVWVAMKVLMEKRARAVEELGGGVKRGSSGSPRVSKSRDIELTSVVNVLHEKASEKNMELE